MNRISPKRKATVKLAHNSTFAAKKKAPKKVYSIAEMKAAGLLQKASKLNGQSVRQKAKNKAWKQFSLYVRLRDSDEHGMAICCTCGARKHWKRLQAGHYVTRKKEATLFDEKCVHAQCAGCNKWQQGRPLEYEQFLERTYGQGTALALRQKAVHECKRPIGAYYAIEATYKAKAEELLRLFPGKG